MLTDKDCGGNGEERSRDGAAAVSEDGKDETERYGDDNGVMNCDDG